MDSIKKYLKKFHFKKKAQIISFGANPEADWRLIFVSGCLLTFFIVCGCVFVFVKVGKGEIFVVKESTSDSDNTLNTALLEETVKYYQDKAATFEEIKNSKPVGVDPAL